MFVFIFTLIFIWPFYEVSGVVGVISSRTWYVSSRNRKKAEKRDQILQQQYRITIKHLRTSTSKVKADCLYGRHTNNISRLHVIINTLIRTVTQQYKHCNFGQK